MGRVELITIVSVCEQVAESTVTKYFPAALTVQVVCVGWLATVFNWVVGAVLLYQWKVLLVAAAK